MKNTETLIIEEELEEALQEYEVKQFLNRLKNIYGDSPVINDWINQKLTF